VIVFALSWASDSASCFCAAASRLDSERWSLDGKVANLDTNQMLGKARYFESVSMWASPGATSNRGGGCSERGEKSFDPVLSNSCKLESNHPRLVETSRLLVLNVFELGIRKALVGNVGHSDYGFQKR